MNPMTANNAIHRNSFILILKNKFKNQLLILFQTIVPANVHTTKDLSFHAKQKKSIAKHPDLTTCKTS